jgi:hypothetical protein
MSNLPAQQGKYPLPKIEDLYADKELAVRQNELNRLLNMPPKPEWIKLNPFADNAPYLPIERVEYLLTALFLKWRLEIKEVKLLANSVVVTSRLHVLDQISGEWDWQDGVGAAPLQTAKGAGAIEFDKIKGAAVQMGAPAAESYSLKDAAEKFGKLFGKDLGRKDELNYAPMQEAKANALGPVPEELAAVIEEVDNEDAWENIWKNNPIYHANRDFMTRMKARRQAFAKKEDGHE